MGGFDLASFLCFLGRMRQDLMVTKSNALVEAVYKLGVNEQRVLAMLVAQVEPDDEDFKPYRFKVSEIEAMIESGSHNNHRLIEETAKGLLKKPFKIHDHTGWFMCNWLSSARYIRSEGIAELCFDPGLKPYLLGLQERFTTYKLNNVVKLRSRYSVRLYELLKQYESLGKRSFELLELRKTLGLEDGEYAKWKDFRVWVLGQAERELPKKTDLGFSYETRKSGRAVAFVDFKIWSTQSKNLTGKQLKTLSTKAQKCWAEIHGSCAAKWSNYETNPTHACHWCQKFEKPRLEAQGQKKLFPEEAS